MVWWVEEEKGKKIKEGYPEMVEDRRLGSVGRSMYAYSQSSGKLVIAEVVVVVPVVVTTVMT